MRKQYKSEILAAVHETALGLHEAGVLNKAIMKTFDEMCLTPRRSDSYIVKAIDGSHRPRPR